MQIKPEFLSAANHRLREVLLELRPQLLKAHGEIAHELKDDASAVTEMDLLVEQRLHQALGELNPDIGLAGEETGADFDQETFWLVDPIDGTEPFIRGLPFSTNMIALIHHGEVIMSVIYNFALDEYFYAHKGGGAFMNGHPIHVSDRTIDRSYVVFGSRLRNPRLYGLTDRLRQRFLGMPQMAASGYTYTALARGALDGVIVYNTKGKAWDQAPGSLLVSEAGGRVENFFASGYDYQNLELLAAAPTIFDEVKQLVQDEITAVQPEHDRMTDNRRKNGHK